MKIQQRELQIIPTDRDAERTENRMYRGTGTQTSYRSTGARMHTTAAVRRRKKRKRQICRRILAFFCVCGLFLLCLRNGIPQDLEHLWVQVQLRTLDTAKYPKELLDLADENPETFSFVKGYPDRDRYTKEAIDLSGDVTKGKVPLLMQWDRHWGYFDYGDTMLAFSGCGPTCMAMAYVYFTGDLSQNPITIADYAQAGGYHSKDGTSWTFWTDGAAGLGLTGETLPLQESSIRQALDDGKLVVCSMASGDFTKKGHYILLTGYDENGFTVNDPNHKSNSRKHWDYDTLSTQIKNLWSLSG